MKRLCFTCIVLLAFMVNGFSQNVTYKGSFCISGVSNLDDDINGAGIELRTTHGININNDAFIGAGVGFICNFSDNMLPVYVQAKQSFNVNSSLKPYACLSVGVMFDEYPSVAPYVAPEIGVSYKHFGIFALVSLGNFTRNYAYNWPGGYTSFDCMKVRMLSAGISYSFGAGKNDY